MGISQNLLNLDSYYHRTSHKVVVNDLNFFSAIDITKVNEELMTVYNSVTISITPQCSCGHLKDAYLMDVKCPQCGTIVQDPTASKEPLLWLRSLEGQPKFINPIFWSMLRLTLSKKVDYLRWLSDSSYNPQFELPVYMHQIKDLMNGERTYKSLVDNLERIIDILPSLPYFK